MSSVIVANTHPKCSRTNVHWVCILHLDIFSLVRFYYDSFPFPQRIGIESAQLQFLQQKCFWPLFLVLLRNGVRSKKRALNNQNKCNLRKNGEPFLGTIFQTLINNLFCKEVEYAFGLYRPFVDHKVVLECSCCVINVNKN